MNAPTDWMSALAIVAAGLVLGFVVFFVSRRRKASAANKRFELEARRDSLVQQLRDLGDDVADDERVWLERETAEVLRALDRVPVTVPAIAPSPRRTSAGAGFVWGMACTLIAGGIVYYGSTFASNRNAPADVEQRIALAKDAFARNDLTAVFDLTKGVLAEQPNEPRALTYNAVARMARGEMKEARVQLEQATQLDPKLLDAWVALASVRTQTGDKEAANAAIEAAIKQRPEEEKQLRGVFAEMQKPPAQLPPDHPPMPGMTPARASGSPSQPSEPIHLTLELDPASTVKGGIVYVIARGGEAGHPVAVKRIETNAFPLTIDFGTADSMMGAALPEKLRLEARLDSDGDAGTNDPSDPRGFANGVTAGTAVTLTLARAN
ncbi:MAG: cytochrome c-type biosis protein CcmH [Acidobacteriota bacterium]|jgi:cytochrome c-type biogenesis protein CcmH/NrfG|nr:cytochrome c-type biosis protein CcmH [Acidobacteriota bacterium]